jgi:hypothetical protein
MAYIPLVTCVVSFIFAVTVLDQFFARRKPFQLLWAIGLFMYAASTFTEYWWYGIGHNEVMYRLWYLIGAILVAAYLGQGTLYLLMKRRWAHIIMGVLGAATVFAAYRMFTANLDISGLDALTGKGVVPTDVRAILTPILNAFGTFALAGGAAWSAWIFWRKRILPHRVVSNVLIAVGAILPAAGGIHGVSEGANPVFLVLELLGVAIMFVGFLRTKEVFGLYRFPLIHGFGKVEEKKPAEVVKTEVKKADPPANERKKENSAPPPAAPPQPQQRAGGPQPANQRRSSSRRKHRRH